MQQMQQMQQMQAAAQMQAGAQMPMMQMGAQMPMMMPMMQMGAEGVTAMPAGEDEEDREMSMLSEEELGIRIRSQDALVKEAEKEAKKSVDKGTYPSLKYVGTIISIDPDEGFGFVHCPSLQRDSFLGQKNIAENDLEVGDVIAFKIEDNIGKPKVSFNPKVLKDVTKQKKKLQKLRDKAKQLNMQSKRQGTPGNSMISMTGAVNGIPGMNLMPAASFKAAPGMPPPGIPPASGIPPPNVLPAQNVPPLAPGLPPPP